MNKAKPKIVAHSAAEKTGESGLDDILKRMLSTPPKPRVKPEKKKQKQSKKTAG